MPLAALLLGPCQASVAKDLVLDDWSVSGTNTIRLEEYAIAGDETSSIFPFEGFQPYDELSVRFARADSPYDRWRGEFVGLLNESDYRSPNDGIVLERFNLTREKGDGSLPHRLEVGDYFGYFSYRTLQRTLKGGQIDLQPRGGWAGERHSVQVLSGFVNPSYRDLDPLEDYYNGASWLVSHPDWGNFSLNGVHNIRKSDPDAGRSADVSQGVISAAAERGFTMGTHGVSLEGEIAGFLGDAQSGTTVREDERDIGYFAQLSGRDQGPLSYGARFEYYGRDFRPNGAVIVPNRRTYELRSAWRFDDGQRLRGRLQRFTDDVESAVSLDTKVAGVTLTGPLSLDMLPGLTSRLDASIRDIERGDGSFDTFTRIVSWDLSAPLTDAWSGRLGLLYRTIDDKPRAVETITREVRLGGDRAVRYRFLSGIFSAGLVMRDVTGVGSERFELGPSVAVTLAGRGHTIRATYDFLSQNLHDPDTTDVYTNNIAVAYDYRVGRHRFGADGVYHGRLPDRSAGTSSFKLGVFWSVDFERRRPGATGPAGVAPLAQAPSGVFSLAALAPGLGVAEAQDAMRLAGITGGSQQVGAVLYETSVIDIIDERQRVVLTQDRGTVVSSAVIIDIADPTDARRLAQTFERAREYMLARYGAPARTLEIGAFAADIEEALAAERFARVAEWDTPTGVLRLGIPRRLDRIVRIEIRHARDLPDLRKGLWSLESVR